MSLRNLCAFFLTTAALTAPAQLFAASDPTEITHPTCIAFVDSNLDATGYFKAYNGLLSTLIESKGYTVVTDATTELRERRKLGDALVALGVAPDYVEEGFNWGFLFPSACGIRSVNSYNQHYDLPPNPTQDVALRVLANGNSEIHYETGHTYDDNKSCTRANPGKICKDGSVVTGGTYFQTFKIGIASFEPAGQISRKEDPINSRASYIYRSLSDVPKLEKKLPYRDLARYIFEGRTPGYVDDIREQVKLAFERVPNCKVK